MVVTNKDVDKFKEVIETLEDLKVLLTYYSNGKRVSKCVELKGFKDDILLYAGGPLLTLGIKLQNVICVETVEGGI